MIYVVIVLKNIYDTRKEPKNGYKIVDETP